MKRFVIILIILIPAFANLSAYPIMYAEEYYRLYHRHFYSYPEDINENIYYLEKALAADFSNPLYAIARIKSSDEYSRYINLFRMHVNLKIIEQYRIMASKFDKRTAYFFNAPWKEDNLESLEIAEHFYETALYYWEEALYWSDLAWSESYYHFEEIQYWEDENYRIQTNDLNYAEIIGMDLARLEQVRADFEAMDENTF